MSVSSIHVRKQKEEEEPEFDKCFERVERVCMIKRKPSLSRHLDTLSELHGCARVMWSLKILKTEASAHEQKSVSPVMTIGGW